MVHKKYTYKKGKRFGPYYYETKRVNGKVVTTYLGRNYKHKRKDFHTIIPPHKDNIASSLTKIIGSKDRKRKTRNSILAFIGLCFLGVLLLLILFFPLGLTGKASLDIDSAFFPGEEINGKLILNLRQGELIPKNTKVLASLGEVSKEFALSELVEEIDSVEGDYYVEGYGDFGRGEGYGLISEKEFFPEIEFDLFVFDEGEDSGESEEEVVDGDVEEEIESNESGGNIVEEGNESVIGNNTVIGNESVVVPEIDDFEEGNETEEQITEDEPEAVEEVTDQVPDEVEEESDNVEQVEADLVEDSEESVEEDESSGESLITGDVISQSGQVIQGSVTKEERFEYNLEPGQGAEISFSSIKINGVKVDKSYLDFKIKKGKVIVTTDFSETKSGFGEEFLGKKVLKMNINISKLGFTAFVDSKFVVEFIYSEEILVSAEKDISVVEIPEKTLVNETILNETVSNITNVNVNVSVNTTQFGAVLGEPVRWVKKVEVGGKNSKISIELPESAENVSVKTFDRKKNDFEDEGENEEDNLDKVESEEVKLEEVEGGENELEKGEDKKEINDSNIENKSEFEENLIPEDEKETGIVIGVDDSITGAVSADIEIGERSKFVKWFRNLFGITGRVVSETNSEKLEIVEVAVNESVDEIEVEYYTGAPYSIEEEFDDRKRVTIVGPDDVHYENVLVFAEFDESLEVLSPANVKIYWEETEKYVVPESVIDRDGNGILDYVSWVVPQLSNQTFQIIVVVKAEHLDENRTFISDIYEEVVELDGNWSETIPSGDYVRVTFEKNLTSENDITVYPRIISGEPRIEIYVVNGTELIAEFESLLDEEYNKVYLDGLVGEQDTFDLLITNGDVEFDHIIDPTEKFFEDCLSITDWTVSGCWAPAVGECQCKTNSADDYNMTSTEIDLSGVANANLSFGYITNSFATNFTVLANSSVSSYKVLFSVGASASGTEVVELEDYITLDSKVTLRGECLITSSGRNQECTWDNINVTDYTETVPPGVTINFPYNYTFNDDDFPLNFNVTLNENGSVLYTLDNGVINVSMTGDEGGAFGKGFNHTNASLANENYTFQVYANDTVGNINYSESAVFNVNNTIPKLVIADPSPTDGSSQDVTSAIVNLSTVGLTKNHFAFTDFDNDLFLWMRMDDRNASGDPTDISSYGYNGTLIADANVNYSGKFGEGVDLDGTGDYINVSYTILDPSKSNFSAFVWFKSPSGSAQLISQTDGAGTGRTYLSINAGGDLVTQLRQVGGSALSTTGTNYSGNNWHHVGFVWNGTSRALWADGNLVANDLEGNLESSNGNLHIGISKSLTSEIKGTIDEVMIFNRTLIDTEILALYNATNNQSIRNFSKLSHGSHTFVGHSVNDYGNKNDSSVTFAVNANPQQPNPNINSTDLSNLTTQDLHCYDTLSDNDGDAMNVTVWWYNESIQHLSIDFNNSYVNGTFFANATLDSANTTKGENWTCGMRMFDGFGYSKQVNTSNLQIINSIPSVPVLSSPTNGSSTTDRTPTFTWGASSDDDSGETITYELNVSLVAASTCSDTDRYVQSISGTSQVITGDLLCLYDNSDYYKWYVRSYDAENFSAWSDPFIVNISALVDILLINATVEFGDIGFEDFNDTSDDFPPPFLIENNGTVFINLTIVGTDLWNTASNPTSNYQFKVDNKSDENNSFSYTTSIVDYTNVPSSASLCVAHLNYTDATDTAEIDINVTVPSTEDPGARTSTITLTASLDE